MIEYGYCEGGPPYRMRSIVKRKIGGVTRNGKVRRFKIGITCDPERRWREAYKGLYDQMYVVYWTRSERNVNLMEREMIDHNWIDRCDNLVGGGGGPKSTWYREYFLYVVVTYK